MFWRKVSNNPDFVTENHESNSNFNNNILFHGNNLTINGNETNSASGTLKTLKQHSYSLNTPSNNYKINKDTFVPVASFFTTPLGIATPLNNNYKVTGKKKFSL